MAKKGRKDGMSEAEYRKYVKSYQTPCSKESCDGAACYTDLGWGKYFQCNKCDKAFGYEDGRGSSITKAKYDSLAERARNRPAKGAGTSCPAEEDEMAKTKKKAKKSSKGTAKKSSAPRTPEERATATASGMAASLLVTTKLDDAAVAKKVLAKFPDAAIGYREASKFKSVKFIRNDIILGDARFDWVQGLKGFKKPEPTMNVKPKSKAKPKAKPKKKAKAKKKVKK